MKEAINGRQRFNGTHSIREAIRMQLGRQSTVVNGSAGTHSPLWGHSTSIRCNHMQSICNQGHSYASTLIRRFNPTRHTPALQAGKSATASTVAEALCCRR